MELLAFFAWLLLALVIPLILIVASYFKYIQQVKVSKIILRFFIAIVAYIPVTAFVFFHFIGLIDAVIHKRILSSELIFFSIAMVFVYAVFGWLLSAFVNSGFIKPWLIFSRDYNKTQSIFDKQ